MSFADEVPPNVCINMNVSDIQEQLVRILDNLPHPDDSLEEAAKKYTILGRAFRAMKDDVKESLKATVKGQDEIAYTLLRGSEHVSLQSFAQVTIAGPDGIEHEIDPKTALKNLDRAEKMVRGEQE